MSIEINDEKFEEVMKNMEKKVGEAKELMAGNIFKSILTAFLIGLAAGIIASFMGRRGGKRK